MRSSYFYWTGLDRHGHIHRGYVCADDTVQVQASLAVRGVSLLSCSWSWRSVCSIPWWQGKWLSWRTPRAMPHLQQAQWCRGLATLLAAGMPLIRALHLLALQEARSWRTVFVDRFQRITRGVRSGRSLSEILARYDSWFSQHVIAAIAAAEGGDQLTVVLNELAVMLEEHAEQRRALRHALLVPLLTIGAALVIGGVALSVVVPMMVSLCSSAAELPASTQMLLRATEWLQRYAVITVCGVTAAGALAWRACEHWPPLHRWRDRLFYMLPVCGRLYSTLHAAQWLRRISVQLRAGVSLVAALESVQRHAADQFAHQWQAVLAADVRGGMPFVAACARVPERCLPATVSMLVGLAPHNAALGGVCFYAAQLLQREVRYVMMMAVRLAQPLALAIVGMLVFVIVRALYAPLLGSLYTFTQ